VTTDQDSRDPGAQEAQRDLVEQALQDEQVALAMAAYQRVSAFAPQPFAAMAKLTVATGANS
jgi:hypothetical protein